MAVDGGQMDIGHVLLLLLAPQMLGWLADLAYASREEIFSFQRIRRASPTLTLRLDY